MVLTVVAGAKLEFEIFYKILSALNMDLEIEADIFCRKVCFF